MKRLLNTVSSTLCLALAIAMIGGRPCFTSAQTLTNLHSFGAFAGDGQSPGASLLAIGSVLYGTASAGGVNGGYGTIFSLHTDGSGYTNLHSFGATGDGRTPQASLITADSNTLFGTTTAGGTNNDGGTLFAIDINGSGYTLLHEFGVSGDGRTPEAALALVGSTLYGTTYGGGSNSLGTVFAIDTDGLNYRVLYHFGTSFANDAANPWGPLTAIGSTLYGTTYNGGANDKGAIFFIDTNGANYTILHQLGAVHEGDNPRAPLTQVGSRLYGSAFYGGMIGDGTLFAITPDGSAFTNLHQFEVSGYDGQYPWGLTLAFSNTLYGTTYSGGSNSSHGTIFAINTNGTGYTTVYQFDAVGNHPRVPKAGLILVGSNTLYGTTFLGGAFGAGAVFQFIPPPPTNAAPIADLSITKTDGPDPASVSSNLTYTITVTNRSATAATGVIVTDSLPSGTAFVSASSGCANNNGTVTCDLGDLAGHASVIKSLVVTVQSSGLITNTAVVSSTSPDTNQVNNTATAITTAQPTGGGASLTGTLSKVKEKCKTKNDVTTCKLGAGLALLNSGDGEAPATHVRFFLSTDANYNVGDTLLGEAMTKTIKPGKSGKAKLKAVTSESSAGQFILVVDDDNGVLASIQVPAI